MCEFMPFSHTSGRLILIALAATTICAAGFYYAKRSGSDPSQYNNDFNVYSFAAREIVASGDPYQNSVTDWTPYLYTPVLAVLLIPLSLLPLPVAAYLWFLLNAASFALAAAWSSRLSLDTQAVAGRVARPVEEKTFKYELLMALIGVTVVIRFALDNFELGQVNPLVTFLIVAHFHLLSRDKKGWSALALAVAASVKLSPLLLIPYHLARKRAGFALTCTALFACVVFSSFAVLGSKAPGAFASFWERTVRNGQGYDLAYAGNQSLRGFTARVETSSRGLSYSTEPDAEDLRRSTSSPLTLSVALLMFGLSLVTALRAKAESLAAAPWICLIPLLSPLAWKAHFVVLVLPACVLAARALGRGSRLDGILAWIAIATSFALFNITSPRIVGLRAAEWADAHSGVMIGACLLFVATALIASLKRK